MKVKVPKSYKQLSHTDQQDLKKFTQEVALEASEKMLERNARIMLEIYMKMVCVMLHDMPDGYGEKRLRVFLAGHKRVFARQFRLVERGEQLQYLNKRMDEIFKKDGFPQNFVDDLLGEVDVEVK
jgi:hypothetical protein